MLPILLISQYEKAAETFIEDAIATQAIPSWGRFDLKREKTAISIDQIRDMSRQISKTAGIKRLFVVWDFDSAKPPAQNAFLKTLEEKDEFAVIIIVSHNRSAILETIQSRVKVIVLQEKKRARKNEFDVKLPLDMLLEKYGTFEKKGEKAADFCTELLEAVEHNMLPSLKKGKLLRTIIETRSLIMRNNVHPQLAVDYLLITLAKEL